MIDFTVHKLQHSNCKKPEYLFFIIHGYGDFGGGILHAFNEISETFLNFLLIAPDGPIRHGNTDGYEWFDLTETSESQEKAIKVFAKGVNSVIYLHEFIDAEVKKYSIPYKNVFLAGFSQGAFIVNHLALTSKYDFAGVISISGGVSVDGLMAFSERKKDIKTTFCLLHGEDDRVLPPAMSRAGSFFLKENGIKNDLHIIQNAEHSVTRQMMEIIISFVRKNLSK